MHLDELDVDKFNVFWQILPTLGAILGQFWPFLRKIKSFTREIGSLGSGIFTTV